MKKSELQKIIKEEIQKVLKEEGTVIWSALQMVKIYKLMKSKGFDPKVNEGNMFNIKTIEIAVPGAGMMKIARDGNLYGDYNWGADVKNETELLKKIEDFKVDQKQYN
jgi:hypothetical protein